MSRSVAGRVPQSENPNYTLYTWFHGSPPPNNTYNVIVPTVSVLARGLTMAGQKLTPKTFQDGLFRYPPSGGDPVNPKQSWGKHGLWPFVDYWGSDDAGILWWDPNASGEDEVGKVAAGHLPVRQRRQALHARTLPGRGPGRSVRHGDRGHRVPAAPARKRNARLPVTRLMTTGG